MTAPVVTRADVEYYRACFRWWLYLRSPYTAGFFDYPLRDSLDRLGGLGGVW